MAIEKGRRHDSAASLILKDQGISRRHLEIGRLFPCVRLFYSDDNRREEHHKNIEQ